MKAAAPVVRRAVPLDSLTPDERAAVLTLIRLFGRKPEASPDVAHKS
jgi:hypothetical protein